MKVLYIGGTGEVSYGCITAGLELGQQISVFNRGTSGVELPKGAAHIAGDINDDEKFMALGRQQWDAVCQFRSYDLRQCERDIEAFAGRVGQFVFISTAMVYQHPPRPYRVTENFPQGNPHSEYAQKKIAIEKRLTELHRAGRMNVTVVRPSHTMRARFPSAFIEDHHAVWRWQHGKPIISHGDGSSLWTVTRCEDFGRAFARLLGNPRAMGETFHITSDQAYSWDTIYGAAAAQFGVEPRMVHVPCDTLVRYHRAWAEPLHGDKMHSMLFDNTKIKQAVGGWECRCNLDDIIGLAAPHVRSRLAKFSPDPKLDGLLDRIIEDQSKLGPA
jgi:nucleoside-diphosphate-sugar epimerase